jgi:alkylation response protein AidB-like acyl-CoA dehydrogenase
MEFSIPSSNKEELQKFRTFLNNHLSPHLSSWHQQGEVPRAFFSLLGREGWLSFSMKDGALVKGAALRAALFMEELARLSPGVAVTVLAQVDLGLTGLWLFGSPRLKDLYGESSAQGNTLLCLGSTESVAGSDVANISMRAEKVDGGWKLNGAKAYVTNGSISDLAIVTAISDPEEKRNSRISMFLVNLSSQGVNKLKLNKQVWIPSDLTRVQCSNVFVPDDHLMGERRRGLQQVLSIFTHSRVVISALALGTASGAFKLAFDHARKRKVFGQKILDQQAKAFEMADLYSRIEAARVMLYKACWAMDQGKTFRLESSLSKYLAVNIARDVAGWAADLFGAASVISDHPVHKFPMDAWAVSLGEGTQDIQKLVIFREVLKRVESGESLFP